MEISKIMITKDATLDVVYKSEVSDVISFEGANICHKDMRNAMDAFIPHLAILTEQREAFEKGLGDLKGKPLINLSVKGLILKGNSFMIIGQRNLESGKVLNLNSPMTELDGDGNVYEYADEVYQLLENVKFEAEAYIRDRKWAMKQTEIDFGEGEDNPFKGINGTVEVSGEVPEANIGEIKETKKKRKSKKAA